MKKRLKLVGKILLWTLAVVIVIVLTLPLWIGPVARGVSQKVVPGITGTDFHLGEFALNIYNGKLHVGDVQLANPTNYSEKNAVDLGKLDVEVAMTSLLSKKIHVNSIDLDGLTVYSSPAGGNFMEIADHASGGEQKSAEEQPEAAEKPAEEAKSEGGVQIDRITLKNITIKYGIVPVKIPMTIELTDIGKDKEEGASWTDAWNAAFDKVMGAAGAVTGAVGDLGKAGVEAVGDLGKAGVGAVSDLGKAGVGAAANALGSLTDSAAGLLPFGSNKDGEAKPAEDAKPAEKEPAVEEQPVAEEAKAVVEEAKAVVEETKASAKKLRKRIRSAVNTGGLFK